MSAGELSGEDEGSESEEEEQEERRQLRQGSTVGRRASVQGEAGAGLGAVLVAAGGAARTGTKRVSGTQAQNACGMGAAAATENNMAVDVVQPMSKSQLKNKVECKVGVALFLGLALASCCTRASYTVWFPHLICCGALVFTAAACLFAQVVHVLVVCDLLYLSFHPRHATACSCLADLPVPNLPDLLNRTSCTGGGQLDCTLPLQHP